MSFTFDRHAIVIRKFDWTIIDHPFKMANDFFLQIPGDVFKMAMRQLITENMYVRAFFLRKRK